MSTRESARERAIRRAAAAAGVSPQPEPAGAEDEPEASEPLGSRVLRRVKRVPNLAASRGDVIKIGKHRAVILTVEWRDPSWAVVYQLLIEKSSRISTTDPQITYVKPTDAPQPLGRWIGEMYPGAHGHVDSPVPSDVDGTDTQTRSTNRPEGAKEGSAMPTVVKRSNKKSGAKGSAKPANAAKSPAKGAEKPAATAKSNGSGSTRRSQADIDALVPKFLSKIKGGATMRAVKQEFGFSDDGPIRAALYRAGYTSKGESHGETAGSIDASKAAGKKRVLALRGEGAGWYRLAYLTGLMEADVKTLVREGGGPTGRVYTQSEKSAAKSSGGTAADKDKAEASARKGSGKKVTRRATKENPSK